MWLPLALTLAMGWVAQARAQTATEAWASAQPVVGQGAKLNLEEVLRSAVNTYPSIAAQRGQKRVAEADHETSKWGRFPTFSAEASRNDYGNNQSVARVQQPLWTGGKISSQIDNTEAGIQAAEAAIGETEQTVLIDSAVAFAEMLRAGERLKAAHENVAELERLHALISRRASTELSPQSDVTLATARLQTALAERLQFENLYLQSRATLEQMSGLRVGAVAMPSRPLPLFASTAEAVQQAIAFSPELARLQAQLAQANAQIGVASSVLWPSVGLVHQQNLGDVTIGQPRNQTYVTVQFQPGAGLSARSTITAANERKQTLQDNTEAARRKLARQIEADWTEAHSLSRQLEPSRALVESTRGVMASYIRQYTAGRKNWQDVMNAQRELAQALYALADTEAFRLRAILRLEIYTGRLTARSLNAS